MPWMMSAAPAPEQCRAIIRPRRTCRAGCSMSTFMDGVPSGLNCSVAASARALSDLLDGARDFGARETHILERAVAQRPKMRDRRLLHAPSDVGHSPALQRGEHRPKQCLSGHVLRCQRARNRAHDHLHLLFLACRTRYPRLHVALPNDGF